MASATATATMMAAGFDKRASTVSSLQTPGSGTFPSEMLSPMAPSPGFMKREDALKTPITPPSAYLDFLKNMSPAVMSPASATSMRFSFNDKTFDRSFEMPLDKIVDVSGAKPSTSPPASQPAVSRNTSYGSTESALSRNTSYESTSTERTVASVSSAASNGASRPQSPRIIIPPSPFAKPAPRSARTPRRLRIPQSPFSPALTSAQSMPSPYSSTPLSAAPWSATYSPQESNIDAIGQPGKVHVRQVVTRTVTYCRTPLDPAPKGKRRKLEVEDVSSTLSEEPPLKQERIEKIEEASPALSI
ncbi:uncharacterized protein RCC_04142 [Ramularia collo-cygni]|uniref:Uncharacterized protein n=1 Tax=Ramularia collo-cygni TaxID=112498 RepID=A0A2D3UTI5_9PEZI|nr:uncharacterized protein RCC_04142 [Ramularia collo-cygni]CZT18298.1 uncharacterized protein RCC_04142 [Ramularia collo-cygni]